VLETILIFAAGFLTASVLALMILPGVNARASRLARRRLAAQFPISIEELTAQMDYVRAEGAVEIRKVERRLEKAREEHARARTSLGAIEATERRETLDMSAQIERLSQEKAALVAERDALGQDRDEKRIAIASLETRLASADAALEALHRREHEQAAHAPRPGEIARENALLRERIEAVSADIIALATARTPSPPLPPAA
jgi:chromosome segregation ATPase